MILQHLMFPRVETCTTPEMYYRLKDVKESLDEKLVFDSAGTANFDTYFNSFSIRTWHKFTFLKNLYLCIQLLGKFRITLYSKEMVGDSVIEKILDRCDVSTDEIKTFRLSIPLTETRGMLAFKLEALCAEAIYLGGYYDTEIEPDLLNDVSIAVTICTFRREKFITKNITTFKKLKNDSKYAELYGKYHLYISDNAKTLNIADLSDEFIHIFPNKNLGGAGGFTRGLVEILNDSENHNFTNVLFMDDDIELPPESLYRTYVLLRMLREEFKEACVCGGQFFLDRRYIQSELASHWDISKHHPTKYKYDMRGIQWVLKNEIQDKTNNTGWWFCCIPFSKVTYNNLPLPIFIKRDDVEYGLRNADIFIGLNGICIWHEPFEYKRSAWLEYYYIRNACIIDAIHNPKYGKKQARKNLRTFILKNILQYKYKEIEYYLLGLDDFLNGIDWLKSQDGELLHKKIMAMNYVMKDVGDLNFQFAYGRYQHSLKYKESRIKRFKRLLTLNGLLLPAVKNAIVPTVNAKSACFYRVRTALNYECITNRGYLTSKSYSKIACILAQYLKMRSRINKMYDASRDGYRDRYQELTNIDFWQKYLFDNHNNTGSSPAKKAEFSFRTTSRWAKMKFFRGVQYLFTWFPVKNNRILLHVHQRKGFTCNPKYICNALLSHYPDKFDIVWGTDYPGSVEGLKERGISIAQVGSPLFYWKLFTSKVIVTNDHLSEKFLKRSKQFLINTWHASIAYKKIGFAINYDRGYFGTAIFKNQHKGANLVPSGSQTFTDNMPQSLCLPKDIFKNIGSPRNDIFFTNANALSERIKTMYHLSSMTKIVLYAPTFRGTASGKSSTFNLDFALLKATLKKRFGGDWVCMYRSHYFYNKNRSVPEVIDVTDYPDMQELLAVADVLITDYSSSIWDFSITLKPSFIYAVDLADYTSKDRDFYNPISIWPYPLAQNNRELMNNILAFDDAEYKKNVCAHHARMGLCESGHSANDVADLIYKQCFKER